MNGYFRSGISFLLFALCSCFVFAQNKTNLVSAIQQNNSYDIRKKIDSLNNLADTLCLHKNETGIRLAQTALNLSKSVNYHIGIGDASHSLGLAKFRRDNDSAIYFFKQARKEYQVEYPGFEKFAFALNNLSRTYDELLQYDSSMHYIRQALEFVRETRETPAVKQKWLMYTYGAMANAFSGQNRNDSASMLYLKAINLAEQLRNNKMLAVYFKSLSGIQSLLGNYHKAAEYGRKAIDYIEHDDRALTISLANMGNIYSKLRDFANADLMADSSLRVGKRTNVTNSIGRNYATLGYSRFQQKKYPEALKYYKTGLENAIRYKNSKSTISNLYIHMGNLYEAVDSLALAKENYIKALQTGDGDNDIVSSINLSLSKIFFKEGDYANAYKYQRDYNLFKDSVFTNEKTRIITELSTRYDSEKKDQQLLILSKDRLLQEALLNKQQQLLAQEKAEKRQQQLEIANYELQTDKQGQLLRIQQLEIANSRAKQSEQQNVIANTAAKLQVEKSNRIIALDEARRKRSWMIFLTSAFAVSAVISLLLFGRYRLLQKIRQQEALLKQRERISRELHDEVGATLSGIAMYSHLAKEQLHDGTNPLMKNSLNIIQQNAGEMVNKLNDIVWLINPGNDNLQQLLQRLEDYAVQMAAVKNIHVKSNINGHHSKYMLPAETRRNIYLLFKEAINNAVKYSNATLFTFSITEEQSGITLEFTDNGNGFDAGAVKAGNGLSNMANRAEVIKARFKYLTMPGKGTQIIMHLPQ